MSKCEIQRFLFSPIVFTYPVLHQWLENIAPVVNSLHDPPILLLLLLTASLAPHMLFLLLLTASLANVVAPVFNSLSVPSRTATQCW